MLQRLYVLISSGAPDDVVYDFILDEIDGAFGHEPPPSSDPIYERLDSTFRDADFSRLNMAAEIGMLTYTVSLDKDRLPHRSKFYDLVKAKYRGFSEITTVSSTVDSLPTNVVFTVDDLLRGLE